VIVFSFAVAVGEKVIPDDIFVHTCGLDSLVAVCV
jgi:hypothetical protein